MDKQTQKNILELVRTGYDQIAGDFDMSRQKKNWPGIGRLAESIKEGDSVLDVGCGNGRLLEVIDKDIKYMGIDNSEKLIEIAIKNYELRIKNYEFMVSNILELGLVPRINFDWVFCIAVLHHLPGEDMRIQALKQLRNKVAENGRIIVTVWNMWPQEKFRKLIGKHAVLKMLGKNKMDLGDIIFEWKNQSGEGLAKRYYHAFTKYGLKRTIKKAGLSIEKIYKDNYNYYAILKK